MNRKNIILRWTNETLNELNTDQFIFNFFFPDSMLNIGTSLTIRLRCICSWTNSSNLFIGVNGVRIRLIPYSSKPAKGNVLFSKSGIYVKLEQN
mgnify:CR=1 FL=1